MSDARQHTYADGSPLDLQAVLAAHAKWLRGEKDGARANLDGAHLRGAKLPHFAICPEAGSFVAYKKLRNNVVATLTIPADARRTSSLVGRKCRASSVVVDALSSGEVGYGLYDGTEYRVGEPVVADSFDQDIRVECTHGIHFFITRKEAEEYE